MSAPERPPAAETPPTGISMATVAANLAAVHRRIESAGGDPAQVRVVAVTKGFGPEAVAAALGAGARDLGENYAQELLAKAGSVEGAGGARWHFLGPLQRNKVPALATRVAWWHSIDRLEAGASVARRQPGGRILVQVNVSGEATKHGCRPEDTPDLVAALRRLDLDVAGLMAIGPAGLPESARPGFRHLTQLARRLGLSELSMGMSSDLEVAVQEGATVVRIGRSLFGPRPRPASPAPVGSLNGGN